MFDYIYSLRGEAKFSTWLYRIAINTALMSLSRPRRALQYSDVELHNVQIPDEDDIDVNSVHAYCIPLQEWKIKLS